MMRAFLRRSPAERHLLLGTAALFVAAHVLLRTRPLVVVRARLQRLAASLQVTAADVRQLQWSIEAVHHALPGRHSCLLRALVCEASGANSGMPLALRIGAMRKPERHHFHAWIEHEGRVIVGHDHHGFTPLH